MGFIDFSIENKEFRSYNFLSKIKENQRPKIMEEDKFKDILWLDINEYKNYNIKLASNVEEFLRN